jgi:hypothetical protein
MSQARRVDVFTWRAPNVCIGFHLDVDHIAACQLEEIPSVRRNSANLAADTGLAPVLLLASPRAVG